MLVAVDGVAPRAKMNQQRTRRFLSAHVAEIASKTDREVRREMVAEAGGRLPALPDFAAFDPNVITPVRLLLPRRVLCVAASAPCAFAVAPARAPPFNRPFHPPSPCGSITQRPLLAPAISKQP